MRVGGRGEGEVTLIYFRIACLLERPQHQIGNNAFFRFPGDFLRQLLIHARSDVDVLGNLVQPRIASTAVAFASFTSRLKSSHWKGSHSQRVSKGRRQKL